MIYCCIDDKFFIGVLIQLLENESFIINIYFFLKRYFISKLSKDEWMMILIKVYSV